jgi:hypothetical protein
VNDERDANGGNFQVMRCFLYYTNPVHVFNLRNKKCLMGESMKKIANHAKVKNLSKDYIFHIAIFY